MTTLSDGQYAYRGLVFGLGTNYPLTLPQIEGLEGFEARIGDSELPRGHGSTPGKHFRTAAQMFAPFLVYGSRTVVEARIADLRDTFLVSEDDQFPLEFKKQGQPQRLIYCRPVGFARGDTIDGGSANPKVALVASDPRIYSVEETTTVIPLYSPAGGGIDYPVNYPKNFAAGAQAEAVVVNDGNADAYPTLRFYGPAGEVSVTNMTTGQSAVFVTTILAGQVLTYNGTAAKTGSSDAVVALDGAGRYSSWQLPRVPLALPPGESVLRFESDDAAAVAVMDFRSTWLS